MPKSAPPKKCCPLGNCCCHPDKLLPWLLAILFTILITVSAIYAYQAYLSRKPRVWVEPPFLPPTETPTSDTDLSTWQIYTNNQFDFEFKYPSYYTKQECAFGLTTPKKDSLLCLNNDKEKTDLTSTANIVVDYLPDTNVSNFQQKLIQNVVFEGSGLHPESFNQFTKAKIGLTDFYYIQTGLFEGILGINYYSVSKTGTIAFRLTSSPKDWINPEFNPENDLIHKDLKQILSTFKFFDATTTKTTKEITENWNTIKFSWYGLTCKIPEGWGIINDALNGRFIPVYSDKTFTEGFSPIQIQKNQTSKNNLTLDLNEGAKGLKNFYEISGSEPEFDYIISTCEFSQVNH